ncbi:hypothetical protein QQY66_35520 [Streptomyces sp. DG2A-72]|uniref:hypothetical protein n=1 Tax=Streptomyces sp. DG2A-72 TaxID=3051386 RepID=UPI00265C05E9|nr:hypothetical protein [Streptomyces sp. DG2A-72]MDO0936766.1 hypothetical protein [Streptomyces sp. DG2A-72]
MTVRPGGTEADLRTELPRHRVWQHGEPVDEPYDVTAYRRADAVGFLLGRGHASEGPLRRAEVPAGRPRRARGPRHGGHRPLPDRARCPAHIGDPAALGPWNPVTSRCFEPAG